MLDMNIEFRKGILFVRLYGELTSSTAFKIIKEVNFLIEENGFDNVVLNLKNIFKIDNIGFDFIYQIFHRIEKYNGNFLICLSDSKEVNFLLEKKHLNRYVTILSNELSAFKLVRI